MDFRLNGKWRPVRLMEELVVRMVRRSRTRFAPDGSFRLLGSWVTNVHIIEAELVAATEAALAVSCLARKGKIEFDLEGRLDDHRQRRRKKFKRLRSSVGEDEEETLGCDEGRRKDEQDGRCSALEAG